MNQASIVQYWHSVELLQPQSIPAIKKREFDAEPFIHDLTYAGGLLPWQHGSPVQGEGLPKDRMWSHLLYARCYDNRLAIARLEEIFGAGHGYKEASPQLVALFAVRFDAAGRMVEDSLVLSSAAWFLGCVLSRRDWVTGFEAAQEDAKVLAAQKLSGVVTANALAELTQALVANLRLDSFFNLIAPIDRFISTPVKSDEDPGEDPLNSFILSDLSQVAGSLANQVNSAPLTMYLTRHSGQDRTDISQDANSTRIISMLNPGNYPVGCWPTEGGLGLVHSQQFAVNTLIQSLGRSKGLLSVNGPPGTGKTTLLRDIVASVITQRAEALASLDRASSAFIGSPERASANGKMQTGHRLADSLLGHEIVVASSNNGAVENVTLELPQRNKVDPSWLEEYDYFSDISECVSGEPAWGLISAALGNKSNRSKFIFNFWNNTKTTQVLRAEKAVSQARAANRAAKAASPDAISPDRAGAETALKAAEMELSRIVALEAATPAELRPPTNFRKVLDRASLVEHTSDSRLSAWKNAVTRFQHAKNEEEALRHQSFEVKRALTEMTRARQNANQKAQELGPLRTRQSDLNRRFNQAVATELPPIQTRLLKQLEALEQHQRLKPSFIKNLRTFWGASRQWRTTHDLLAKQVAVSEQTNDLHRRNLLKLEAQIQALEEILLDGEAKLALLRRESEQAENRTLSLARQFNAAHLVTWIKTGVIGRGPDIELAEPWQIPSWRHARAKVFMEALNLHKTFFELEARRIRSNLWFAMSILEGNQYVAVSAETLRSVWATLFMAVPVLSSTFASFARTFKTLRAGDIGWLLVDEAGQATPQAAVGALWRARRAIMVGDPLQLEPVLTVPEAALEHMRTAFNVDPYWMPSMLSAQSLADEANPTGRLLGPAGEKTWVGLPLAVHRRCDYPMYDLANRIAYDGSMVYGTMAPPPGRDTTASLPTGWIHVTGKSSSNWISEEGLVLEQLLARLKADGVPDRQISVITPFQDVRNNLRRMLKPPMVYGTIHTMQGKESAVVILVLGGKTDGPGAREWAVSKPNLLNVAATRAKRRLFVIGDRADWSNRALFRDVMDLLPELRLTTVSVSADQAEPA
ncbi:AAA domain-containing protein [Geopseudomonas aromaticivorans]